MEIFISWRGKKSHAVAEALRGWLPQIVNAFQPFLSSTDIDKGARWRTEISTKLASTSAGIICLTPANLSAPWLLFEAGAISKAPEKTYVCTLLVDLQPSDVTDPLAQFQATRAAKEDFVQLVKNLNKALGETSMPEAFVERAFEKWWPDLEKILKNLPPDEETQTPRRSDRDLLEELVDLTRATKGDAREMLLIEQFERRFSELSARMAELQMRVANDNEYSQQRLLDQILRQREETIRLLQAAQPIRAEDLSRFSEEIRGLLARNVPK